MGTHLGGASEDIQTDYKAAQSRVASDALLELHAAAAGVVEHERQLVHPRRGQPETHLPQRRDEVSVAAAAVVGGGGQCVEGVEQRLQLGLRGGVRCGHSECEAAAGTESRVRN